MRLGSKKTKIIIGIAILIIIIVVPIVIVLKRRPAGPVVDSTDESPVLLGDAFTVAANFGGGGYDIATDYEVREHNPSKHIGHYHWARLESRHRGKNWLVSMRNAGSVEAPDWKYWIPNNGSKYQDPRVDADHVYVIKRAKALPAPIFA